MTLRRGYWTGSFICSRFFLLVGVTEGDGVSLGVLLLVVEGVAVPVLLIVLVGDGDGVPVLLNVPECEEVAVFADVGDKVGDILLATVPVSEAVKEGVKLLVWLGVLVTVGVDGAV